MSLAEILEQSTTYQEIIEKGEARGRAEGFLETARAMILRLGAKRFGPASAEVEAAVRAVANPDRLDRLADRVLDATGWDDLLATP